MIKFFLRINNVARNTGDETDHLKKLFKKIIDFLNLAFLLYIVLMKFSYCIIINTWYLICLSIF